SANEVPGRGPPLLGPVDRPLEHALGEHLCRICRLSDQAIPHGAQPRHWRESRTRSLTPTSEACGPWRLPVSAAGGAATPPAAIRSFERSGSRSLTKRLMRAQLSAETVDLTPEK